ncbi:MAG: DMT family transporter [Alphaproteobacteria bacterium]|nr:DMT family transporter [Rickettsiales bacterium]
MFGFFGVLLTIVGKYAIKKANLDPMLLMSMRYVILFLCILPILIYRRFSFLQNLSSLRLNIFKDVLLAVAALIWYKSAVMIPINNAITVAFLNPVFVLIIDAIIRKEMIPIPVLIGVFVSFVGICFVVGFDISAFNSSFYPYLLILLVSLLRSVSAIITSKVVCQQNLKDIFYSGITVQFLIATVVLLANKSSLPNYLSMEGLFLISIISALFGLYYLCYLMAIKLTDLSWLQPFDFLRTVFSAIMSYIILGESLHFTSAVGSLLVIGGVWYAAKHGKKLVKNNN